MNISRFSTILRRGLGLIVALSCGLSFQADSLGQSSKPERPIDFARDIQPILSENCYFCHGPDEANRAGDLRLDIEETARDVIDGEVPSESELYRRIISDDADEKMPPPDSNRQLTQEQQQLIADWIAQGATWSQHWALTPIQKPSIPFAVADKTQKTQKAPKHPIDAFIGNRLTEAGLSFSPRADRRMLIRRVAIDLTGLPPTEQELTQFLNDDTESAYLKMVDRYLASPAYGERMAWPWLDAARYADSNGYQQDAERTMWPWRDWVVSSFNRNLPFDQFSTWQLGGDQIPNATREQRLATAFLRNHPINGEGGRIAEENRVDYVMDMTETTGTVWLGLTFNCCRCHDHKYDRLSQKEYYQMSAFFNQTPVTGAGGNPQTAPVLPLPSPAQTKTLDTTKRQLKATQEAFQKRLNELEDTVTNKVENYPERLVEVKDDEKLQAALKTTASQRTADQRSRVRKAFVKADAQLAELDSKIKLLNQTLKKLDAAIPKVMVMQDMPKGRKTFVLERGSYQEPKDEVLADVPAMLPPLKASNSNRLTLANWLFEPEHPLTARVAVNRLWEQVFGIGIVKTTEDFGVQGEPPSHPELLDWLAAEYRESGWDTKHMLRLILTSQTYQQTSKTTLEALEKDPTNRLHSRAPRYRMPSWMIRDYALAASGQLVHKLGGPPVNAYQPAGVWEEASFGKKKYQLGTGSELYRRSLYTFWRRIAAPTLFFDNPDRMTCSVNRNLTNTPLHALTTLNDTTYVEACRLLAARILKTADVNSLNVSDIKRIDSVEHPIDRLRLNQVFTRFLARPPHSDESEILLAGLSRTRKEFEKTPAAAFQLISVGQAPHGIPAEDHGAAIELASWTTVCLAILNLDETLTRQ